MGHLIVLGDRVEERAALRVESDHPGFYFDLACPFSYLAAERIERSFGEVEWVPARLADLLTDPQAGPPQRRAAAEERAAALRLPIGWQDPAPTALGAMRAAAYAAAGGAAAPFALAAFRLSFCGGYDIDEHAVLAELASSVGIPRAGVLQAASDPGRDEALTATARGLERRGVSRLPAFRIGERWFQGEQALLGAAALHRARRHPPVARPA